MLIIDLFTVYDAVLAVGKHGQNYRECRGFWRDFGPLGTAITPLQRGGFPRFATTSNSFIDIIHSTENKAIKEGTTSAKFEL